MKASHKITMSGPQQVMISCTDESIISDNDFFEYWETISAAFGVHLDRERIRQGLWKEYLAARQGDQIKTKIDRVLRSLERIGGDSIISRADLTERQVNDMRINAVEELHDIINYSVFAIRLLERRA